MKPQIQYVRTSNGANIAFRTRGNGPPLIHSRMYVMGMDAAEALDFESYADLAGNVGLVEYDHAGIGASQRWVRDFSIDAQADEIAATADRLRLDEFTLLGGSTASWCCALYATRHPERVRGLICVHPVPPLSVTETAAGFRADWSLARRRWASVVYPDGPVAAQRAFSDAVRESMSAEVAACHYDACAEVQLEPLFATVPVRTLFITNRASEERAQETLRLAVAMRDCQVVFIESGEDCDAAVMDFMGVRAPSEGTSAATAVVLFTDIADSTALTERMGDAPFRDASRTLDAALRTAIRDAGGEAIDRSLGDGVLATFPSAAQAIDGARRCLALSAASELGLHIGLHAGDVIREDNNVYGGAVNIASRICSLSAPGEILVSDVVRGMARSSAGVEFEDRGEQAMKGVGEPVRVYAVVSGAG